MTEYMTLPLRQIDKAVKAAGYVDRRDWLMHCIRELLEVYK